MILYAAIARLRDAGMLVEISEPSWKGNAGQVCAVLMGRMRDYPETVLDGDRRTFVHRNDAEESDFFYHFIEACSVALGDSEIEEHFFHVYRKDSILYCCLGDEPDLRDHSVHFAFLDQLQAEFTKMYNARKIDTARTHSLEKDFGPTVRSAIHYHNIHHHELQRDQKVQAILSRIEDFKTVMGRNINLMMENTEQANSLLHMSNELTLDAQVFKRKAKRLHYLQRRRYLLTTLMCLAVVILLLFITLFAFCGPGLGYCRAASSNGYSSSSEVDYSEEEGGNA